MTSSDKQLASMTYLRVKISSLMAEIKIIKEKERKCLVRSWMTTFNGLHEHRVNVCRKECRRSQLALAFLRGVPYVTLEESTYENPDFDEVLKIALRFRGDLDERVVRQRFSLWLNEARKNGIFNFGSEPYKRRPSWVAPPPKKPYEGPKRPLDNTPGVA